MQNKSIQKHHFSSINCSVTQLCPTLCDPIKLAISKKKFDNTLLASLYGNSHSHTLFISIQTLEEFLTKLSNKIDKDLTKLYKQLLGVPCGSAGKESACNTGDLGSVPELGRSPGEGKGYPLQYYGLENSMDCIVHGVTKSRTQLSTHHIAIQIHMIHM